MAKKNYVLLVTIPVSQEENAVIPLEITRDQHYAIMARLIHRDLPIEQQIDDSDRGSGLTYLTYSVNGYDVLDVTIHNKDQKEVDDDDGICDKQD